MNQFDARQFSSDKILKHLDRVNEWLSGSNPPPITVELDMTNICNHKCPQCVVNYFRVADKNALSYGLAKNIIIQLSECKVRGLIFTGGGEPLCNPNTLEIVGLAKSVGLDLGFITNGSLLNKRVSKILLESCTWLRISLDASSPKVFKLTHSCNATEFNKIIKNIETLCQIKARSKSNCAVGVGYLTSEHTASEMEEAAKLCKDLGVDYLQFRPMQIHNGGKFEYSWTDVMENIEKCLNYSSNRFQVLYSKHKYDMMKDKKFGRYYEKCYGHQFATVIAANAKMYICCHTRGYEKYCIGDLLKDDFMSIWNSKQRKKITENIDFCDCIPLCRDNTFNQILWNIRQPKEHLNFL